MGLGDIGFGTQEQTDSTIDPSPPKPAIFFCEGFDTRKDAMKNTSSHIFYQFANDYLTMTSEWQTGDFVNKKLGGGYRRTAQQ